MQKKAAIITAVTLIAFTALAGIINQADATLKNQDIIEKVKNDNARFSAMLNDKNNPEALMQFLHDTIDNEAQITMNINTPDAKQAGEVEVKLSKADYINSYLYGPRQVKDYRADIITLKVDVEGDNITTKEILTESGFMLNPNDYTDPGRAFTSTTSCESSHGKSEDGVIRMQQSTCKTDIRYEESV